MKQGATEHVKCVSSNKENPIRNLPKSHPATWCRSQPVLHHEFSQDSGLWRPKLQIAQSYLWQFCTHVVQAQLTPGLRVMQDMLKMEEETQITSKISSFNTTI
jgi:hypothetical protein